MLTGSAPSKLPMAAHTTAREQQRRARTEVDRGPGNPASSTRMTLEPNDGLPDPLHGWTALGVSQQSMTTAQRLPLATARSMMGTDSSFQQQQWETQRPDSLVTLHSVHLVNITNQLPSRDRTDSNGPRARLVAFFAPGTDSSLRIKHKPHPHALPVFSSMLCAAPMKPPMAARIQPLSLTR